VTLIDFTSLICAANKCSQFVSGEPIYFDDDHLNAYGSKWLAQQVFKSEGLSKYEIITH
jgi:hypothetical protein